MIKIFMITTAIAAGAFGVVAFAKTRTHDVHFRYVTRATEASAGRGEAPHFIRVGPNGYWVTTSWGCWTDEGQGRIQDCNTGGGPGQ